MRSVNAYNKVTFYVIGGKGHIVTGPFLTKEEAEKYRAFYPGAKIKAITVRRGERVKR